MFGETTQSQKTALFNVFSELDKFRLACQQNTGDGIIGIFHYHSLY
jgi:hypothetical protein